MRAASDRMRQPRVTAARPRSSASAACATSVNEAGGASSNRVAKRDAATGHGWRPPARARRATAISRREAEVSRPVAAWRVGGRIVEQLGPPRVQDPDAIEIERRVVARLLRRQLVGEVRQPPPHLRPRPRRLGGLRDRHARYTLVDVPRLLRRPAAGEPPQARRPRQRDPRRGDRRRADRHVADPHRSPQPLVESRPPFGPALDRAVEDGERSAMADHRAHREIRRGCGRRPFAPGGGAPLDDANASGQVVEGGVAVPAPRRSEERREGQQLADDREQR